MQLTMLLLKSGTTLLSQSEELDYEPKVHLFKPYEVKGTTKVTLTSWPQYTDDEHILLHSDTILTVVAPKEELAQRYMKKVGIKPEDLKPKEDEQVLLAEDESVPDEYEPRYIEE